MREQIDGGEKFLAELRGRGFDVAAGCWARTAYDGQWYLYIVTRAVNEMGWREAYTETGVALDQMDGAWAHGLERVDPFAVKLVAPDSPMGRSLLDLLARYPGRSATWFYGPSLGDTPLDAAAYLYPAPVAPAPAS